MFNRSIAFFIAATLYASSMQAKANLIGMPMNLRSSANAVMKARTTEPHDACVLRTDDVFAGPVLVWTCGRSI